MKRAGSILTVLLLFNLGCGLKDVVNEGCTSSCAVNYDPSADVDNDTCRGCTDTAANNYCFGASFDDGSCVLPCEANGTAVVYFINDSNTNSTYDVFWDGSRIATVIPGQSSQDFTVSGNITHSLLFRFTNTSNNACNPSSPIVPVCERWWFSCTG